ncbi:MAG: GDSL-type esterase/lipase family protein [Isosphaeraceae bacterium]
MNAVVYHIASGQAFFSGAMLISLSVLLACRPRNHWFAFGRTVLACLGLILVAVSATPLPGWFYVIAGAASLIWVGLEGSSRVRWQGGKPWLRGAVLAIWWLGVALELPYHFLPVLPKLGRPNVYVVGDSLSAGVGDRTVETWPGRLERTRALTLLDFARMGATVASAQSQAKEVDDGAGLVIVEIGGNDVLGGTTPETFEQGLDLLLSRLRSQKRTVILLELPLPPFYNRYGVLQRRLAKRHGAVLVPKRVLLGVLTTKGATVDSIHLSSKGHRLMAEAVWAIIQPAFAR